MTSSLRNSMTSTPENSPPQPALSEDQFSDAVRLLRPVLFAVVILPRAFGYPRLLPPWIAVPLCLLLIYSFTRDGMPRLKDFVAKNLPVGPVVFIVLWVIVEAIGALFWGREFGLVSIELLMGLVSPIAAVHNGITDTAMGRVHRLTRSVHRLVSGMYATQ